MPDFTMADILAAQAGAPGPVYEGGPTGNVTLADVLGPSWLERAQRQAQADAAAYQRGGVSELLSEPGQTAELAGGFGGNIKAYHGSPYDFAKFSNEFIGTGEAGVKGAPGAYGYGHYFAENPAVAREYRKNLSPYQWSDASEVNKLLPAKYQGSNDASRRIIDDVLNFKGEPKDYLNEFEVQKDLIPAYQKAMETVGSKGKMYEVNINARPEQFVQYDKAIDRQSPQVLQQLKSAGLLDEYTTAPYLAQEVGGDPAKSAAMLREAGIPGIKYLDQFSRQFPVDPSPHINNINSALQTLRKESGHQLNTSNYVVFNPDIVDILRKYGLAGMLGGPTMAGVLQSQPEPAAP